LRLDLAIEFSGGATFALSRGAIPSFHRIFVCHHDQPDTALFLTDTIAMSPFLTFDSR
jgi:hypothetical protein